MTRFERLLASPSSPAVKSLLAAGLRDAPGPESLSRAALALGLGAGAVAVAVPAVAANGAVVGSAVIAAGKAPLASSLSLAVLSKWLVAGAVGGVLVSGTAAVVERARTREQLAHTVLSDVGSAPRPGPAKQAARVAPPLNPLPEAPALPAVELPAAVSVSEPAAASASPGRSSALGAEAARIDAARRALGRGDLTEAQAELDAYQRERSLGVLDREALLLRIQVLVRAGARESAVTLARSYMARHPNDANTARLEALIASNGSLWPAAGIEQGGPGH